MANTVTTLLTHIPGSSSALKARLTIALVGLTVRAPVVLPAEVNAAHHTTHRIMFVGSAFFSSTPTYSPIA